MAATTRVSRALLLVGVVLTAQLCACTSYSGDGFSVEFIHRDSVGSPFHDPSLTAHGRVVKALARSYARADEPSAHGVVSELTSTPFEYLMAVHVGTPPTRLLAIADTGSDLVWLNCSKKHGPGPAFAGDAPSPPPSPGVVFDPAKSKTYRLVGCDSGACRALSDSSCAGGDKCTYYYYYGDGSATSGLLSTETFTFADNAPGTRGERTTRVPNVNFGCGTTFVGSFIGDGLVGLGNSNLSLVRQLGAHASLGRRFSYCLVPYSINASSVLNFGARATVTEPGAATTPLIPSRVRTYYTIDLASVKVGNATYKAPRQTPAIVDSGTTLTFLDKALLDPLVKELAGRIKLPKAPPPADLQLPLCYNVSGLKEGQIAATILDVKLGLGGGAAVTLKALNTFVVVQAETLCLAIAPASERLRTWIIGNIAQQNMHVGYDLDKRTVTFAAADCARAYPAHAPAPGPAHAHAPAPAPAHALAAHPPPPRRMPTPAHPPPPRHMNGSV
ncbi:aspartic proteinase CDR1-like [Triticum dicoccoides]|uniref:aspartic proteinase CDR1-like n=1 Tax=Triticum dicoccoides TaxID=85692 RepID=UPI00188F71BB|nr:aspartic proteinase CDR1-like [Triticum dicoccoides]